ncbi:MAG: hypothetical protein JWQ49_1301 [Edaphobacter sp.]|nr:hypothetical protein [Edaphobacter sp.]
MGADQQMSALLRVGKERRVLHMERVESAIGKKCGVLLVCSGLEGIAEEIERHIRVEGGGTGSAAETLVFQPAPAGAVVGEGEVRRIGRSVSQFSRETGCVCRHIGERDGADAFGHNNARRGIALKRIVEPQSLVRSEFSEDVGGEDLCERAEPQQRILSGKLMGVGSGFAVSAEENMIVANDDENHTGGSGLKEEVCAQSVNGLDFGERRRRVRLCKSRHEGQHEKKYKQGAQEFSVAHSYLQFLGYRTERLLKTEMIHFLCELLTSGSPVSLNQQSASD